MADPAVSSARSSLVHVYGWEYDGAYWHGPTPVNGKGAASANLDPNTAFCSWNSRRRLPGEPDMTVHTIVRDIGDCGLATMDIDTCERGPAAVMAVLPQTRRASLRGEFAFEFTGFLRFLEGPVSTGAELEIHDSIVRILEEEKENSVVFVMGMVPCASATSVVVSEQAEKLATSIVRWLEQRG